MADQNMSNPEKVPVIKELERFEKEAGGEAKEREPEAIESVKKDAEALREKIKDKPSETESREEGALSDEEIIKRKMEVIIGRSLQQVIVAGFDDATLEKIFEDLGKKYVSYPHILKEAQKRIFEERDERISGKID